MLYRAVAHPIAWYREYVPCRALQGDVYALFSFVPGATAAPPHRAVVREVAFFDATFCSPQFADGHVSFVFELGRTCDVDGRWRSDSLAVRGTVIGPMSGVGRTQGGDRPEMVGAYFRPARVAPFLRVAISDLTDTAVAIGDMWGTRGSRLPAALCEMDEGARLEHLESVLSRHLAERRHAAGAVDVERLAASILRRSGRITVEAMARAAGVSRQHLSREFRDQIGIGPKLYARLARFHAGLVYAGARSRVDWAAAAAEMGYADQSHMIAEFRQFSGLTPHALASREWFHPFIERARSGDAYRNSTRKPGRESADDR